MRTSRQSVTVFSTCQNCVKKLQKAEDTNRKGYRFVVVLVVVQYSPNIASTEIVRTFWPERIVAKMALANLSNIAKSCLLSVAGGLQRQQPAGVLRSPGAKPVAAPIGPGCWAIRSICIARDYLPTCRNLIVTLSSRVF